jgi:glucose/arabinose dehydrogenase
LSSFNILLVLIIAVYLINPHFFSDSKYVYAKVHAGSDLPVIKDTNLKPQVVVEGLDHPTQMAFLAPGDFLVLEKNKGTVLRVVNGDMTQKPVIDVNVANKQERGLLGVAISGSLITSNYEKGEQNRNKTKVFLFYTESEEDGNDICPKKSYCEPGSDPKGNRLYMYDLEGNSLVNPKLLLDLPATPGADHLGGVIKIGPDNNIYLTGGDGDSCANRPRCQQGDFEDSVLKSKSSNVREGNPPAGRGGILRITQNGDAVDGGVVGHTDPLDKYYAYGIRNSFGIDFDPITGKLWDTENGPGFGDEVNLVEPGFNSGWLKVQGFWPVSNYNPNPENRGFFVKDDLKEKIKYSIDNLEDFNGTGVYSDPEFVWNKTVGPTAILFFTSDKLGKQYKNDLFVGQINTGKIYHFELNKERTALDLGGSLADKIENAAHESKEIIFAEGFGGITDMDVGPDGYLYVLSYEGTTYRVIPNGK